MLCTPAPDVVELFQQLAKVPLCNVREQIRWNRVDKDVKVFSVGDEFVIYSLKVHLTAHIRILQSTADIIPHEKEPRMA